MITWREATRADVPDLMALLEDGWIGLFGGTMMQLSSNASRKDAPLFYVQA